MAGMNVRDDYLNKIEKPKPSGRDLAYRAVAAVLGGPVDLTAMVMKPFGYSEEKPVLGSEWIGQKMENVGLVSEARDPMKEFMASLLVPGGGIEAVPALAGKGMAMLPAAMGVVKAKGGNWLTGSVEDALKPLKKGRLAFHDQPLTQENLTALETDIATHPARPGSALERIGNTELADTRRKVALNAWVEGPLTKYVKTRMASPDDEIRKLADQGVLHFDPVAWPGDAQASRNTARKINTNNVGTIGETNLGRSWEDVADANLVTNPASIYQNFGSSNLGEEWVNKLDPNTPFHGLRPQSNLNDLGFRHLTDELSNALNPESGLPRALQLSPDQMKSLSVEKAVRRVADINKWRANQMAEANKAIAFDEKTAPIFKEYQTVPGHGNGQPNEKGLHWREIKAPELPAATAEPLPYGAAGDTAAPAKRQANEALKKQLAYEGDTMGHCVGGYCDAVSSGESQVYTLRDKAGKPHVTIEVKPGVYKGEKLIPFSEVTPELRAAYEAKKGWALPNYSDPENILFSVDSLNPVRTADTVDKIEQIKGAKNSAPKDEYVPFIQDFIRNGNFSDVGDLANAQMHQMPDGSLYTTKELESALDAISGSPETRDGLTVEWLVDRIGVDGNKWWPRVKQYMDSLKDQ